jgi:predicted ATPase
VDNFSTPPNQKAIYTRGMFQSFEASHYRGFANVRLNDLSRINLITGSNDVGKTNLLEGILICGSEGLAGGVALSLLQARGYIPSTQPGIFQETSLWDCYFPDFETSLPITLITTGDRAVTVTLQVSKQSAELQQFSSGPILRADARTTSHFRVASHLGLMV